MAVGASDGAKSNCPRAFLGESRHREPAPDGDRGQLVHESHRCPSSSCEIVRLGLLRVFLTSLTQEMGQEHATCSSAAQDAAANQQTHNSTLLVPSVVVTLQIVIVIRFTPRPQEVRQKHPPRAPAAKDPASNQQA